MTYARFRLWLGITGVGSLVTVSFIALLSGAPALLSADERLGLRELWQLLGVTGLFLLWMMPLDLLGGYLLPRRFHKSEQSFRNWLGHYLFGAFCQGILFVVYASLILLFSQAGGVLGGGIAISLGIAICSIVRNNVLLSRETPGEDGEKVLDAITMIQSWQIFVPQTVVVKHRDSGFTGGIIGIGKGAKIVIPTSWLSFSREQLATVIARRAVAIDSGSYTRGLVLAFVWNVVGFLFCSFLPGAGLTTVAGFVATVCGFTIWSFIGLLILPTVSRNASLKIDQSLSRRGMPVDLISQTAFKMDQLQDGEPDRPAMIEMIFHPVPNVTSRNPAAPVRGLTAWNVARTSLFFSWGCLGLLSRAVHCNVGRPELWMMLPTD